MDLSTSIVSSKDSAPPRLRTAEASADRAQLLPPLLAAVLTSITAFWGLTGPQFWYDEAATVLAVDRPLSEIPDLLQKVDAVHGLYYLLMSLWVGVFGTSELAMRAPSALALTLAAPVLSVIAMGYSRRWAPDRVRMAGVIAAVVFATLPGLTWSGQEARGFAMGVLASVAALWCFERFQDRGSVLLLVGWALLQAAAIGFSLYSALAVVLYALRAATWGRPQRLGFAAACTAVGLLVLPLIGLSASQTGQVAWISMSTSQMLQRMALGTFFMSPMNRSGEMGALSLDIAPWLLALVLASLAAGLVRGPGRQLQLWLLGVVALPLVIILAAHLAGHELFQERYVTFSAPFLLLALTLALTGLRWRAAGWIATAAIAALSVPSLVGQNAPDAKIGDSYGDAAALIARADTALFLDPPARAPLQLYPPDHEIADPLLLEDGTSADNIWGWNRSDVQPWEVDPTGPTAVVSYKSSGDHDSVLDHLTRSGCTVAQADQQTRFRITVLDCPGS